MTVNFIASAIPGRIRVRTPALRNPDLLAQMGQAMQNLAGVVSMRPNAAACSIIMEYDSNQVPASEMQAQVETLVTSKLAIPPSAESHPKKNTFRRRANRWAKYGSIASLGVSLAALAVGGKRLHVIGGGVFVAFLAVHMAIHRKHTFR